MWGPEANDQSALAGLLLLHLDLDVELLCNVVGLLVLEFDVRAALREVGHVGIDPAPPHGGRIEHVEDGLPITLVRDREVFAAGFDLLPTDGQWDVRVEVGRVVGPELLDLAVERVAEAVPGRRVVFIHPDQLGQHVRRLGVVLVGPGPLRSLLKLGPGGLLPLFLSREAADRKPGKTEHHGDENPQITGLRPSRKIPTRARAKPFAPPFARR